MKLYLDDLEKFCKTLHHLRGKDITALVDHKVKLLEADERAGLGKDIDYPRYYRSLRRLLEFVIQSGLPLGITEEEAEMFAEVVEKQLP